MNENGVTREYRVPAMAKALMEAMIPDAALCEAVIGDLHEDYQREVSRESVDVASRWYWLQVARSVIPFAALSITRASALDRIRFAAGVLSGYAVILAILIASLWTIGGVVGFVERSNYVSGLLTFAEMPQLVFLWSLVVATVSGVVAGYVAGRVGGRTAVAAALTLGLFGVPLCALTAVPDIAMAPIWFQVMLSAALLPSVMGGALLHRRLAK